MNQVVGYQSYLQRYTEVPERSRQQALEVGENHQAREMRDASKRAQKLESASKSARAKLLKAIGSESYEALIRFLREQRLSLQQMLEPPDGLTRKPGELRQLKLALMKSFLEQRKISPSTIQKITGELDLQLRSILTPEPGRGEIADGARVAKILKKSGAVPWSTFSAPFAGWQHGWYGRANDSDFSISHESYINSSSGLVGCRITLENRDACDHDVAVFADDAQVAFWYLPPRAGLVETWIEAQCADCFHYLRMEDEWGQSWSYSSQYDGLMMHAINADINGPSMATISSFYRSGDPDFQIWWSKPLTQGKSYWAHLFSDAPVPANEWINIRCGTHNYCYTYTNDVEVYSSLLFKWFIKTVYVRTTGT